MAQDAKKGFLIYYDYRKHLSILTDEERGKLLMALLNYGENHVDPELDGAALMAFSFIACQIDRDWAKYEETCRKRSEAGKKGGRPKADGSEREANDPETEDGKAKKAKGFFEKQKKATRTKEKQLKAKKPNTNTNTKVNTNKNTNQNKNFDLYTPPLSPPHAEEGAPKGAAVEEADNIPYEEIVNLYHEICHSYPKLRVINDKRKEALAESFEKYGRDIEVFRELFTKAEASGFLKGKGEKGWQASFNWLIDSDHMAEVLEDKYSDRKKENSSFDVDDFFEAAVARTWAENAENPPKTAGEDESIRKRGEELRQRLAQ